MPGTEHSIAQSGLTGYMSSLMKRIALLMLILALFAPRAAWAVHVSDHDPISAQSAVHVHHAGHSHEAHSTDAFPVGAESDRHEDEGDTDGLVHQHPPSTLTAFAALLPADAKLAEPQVERELVHVFVRGGIRIATPELPDRPPRTA